MMKHFAAIAAVFAVAFIPAAFTGAQQTVSNARIKPEPVVITPASVPVAPGDIDQGAGSAAMAFLEAYFSLNIDGMRIFMTEKEFNEVQKELKRLKAKGTMPPVTKPEVFRKNARLLTSVKIGNRMFAVIVSSSPLSCGKGNDIDWIELNMTLMPGTNVWLIGSPSQLELEKYRQNISARLGDKIKQELLRQAPYMGMPEPAAVAVKAIRAILNLDYPAAAALTVPEERTKLLAVGEEIKQQVTEAQKKMYANAEIKVTNIEQKGWTAVVKLEVKAVGPDGKEIKTGHPGDIHLQFRNGVWQISEH